MAPGTQELDAGITALRFVRGSLTEPDGATFTITLAGGDPDVPPELWQFIQGLASVAAAALLTCAGLQGATGGDEARARAAGMLDAMIEGATLQALAGAGGQDAGAPRQP
jgi:hypothetical protein